MCFVPLLTSVLLLHVVWTICNLKGVVLCVSLHLVNLLHGQASRENVGASGLKEYESGAVKGKISFITKKPNKTSKHQKDNSKNPSLFSVKFFVCFKVPKINSYFSGSFVTDFQNEVRLNLCENLGKAEPALRLLLISLYYFKWTIALKNICKWRN